MPAFRWAKAEILRRSDSGAAPLVLSSSEAFVLLMLADHYSEEWSRAWPSQSLLARETGLAVKTVVRAVESLRASGLVVTETWVNETRAGRIPYRYLLPAYNRKAKPWPHGHVIAYSSWDDAPLGADYDSLLRVPGSKLLVDASLLS
ncbi:hypothetical protein C5C03_04055 [Clavibacter michiganensis]|uniref:helix-turn-helix domain-containing protein n=1 Tax=Clavibacter michiganensis TaxID=28447 RepID=UPI000CE82DD6|nr:helix-turn-helix domain-containing protein [Clavibacter michiganensis]PPF89271.1 hypothetical protein C5C03_04055 [Clavibacter michiganensis]PPF97311.1 hypothetical protein C5C05_05440 [Clavibacter michiganensis]